MMTRKNRKRGIYTILLAVIVVGAVVFVEWFFRTRAVKKAEKTEQDLNIQKDYVVPDKLNTKEETATALWALAVWEEETKSAINDGLHLYGDDLSNPRDRESEENKGKTKDPADNGDDVYRMEIKKRWKALREGVDSETQRSIDEIFEKAGGISVPDREETVLCYQTDHFKNVVSTMEMMQQGKADDVYWTLTGSSLPARGSLLPLDIAFILYPKEMSAACMAAVKQAFEKYSNSAILCGLYVSTAEEYAERYGIEIEGLEEAREEVKRKELKEKQKSRQRTDHASSSGTSSSKKSSGTSKRRRNNSYSPSYSSPDPEDHDIEAYYEDNRDEYDDYDDAYEGFLDDDSAWDDY